MSLDLGALVARVVVEDAGAVRTLTLLMARFKSLGGEATRATAGTAKLDEGLVSVGSSADKAAVGLERASRSSATAAAAEQKAAAAAARHGEAVTAVSRTMVENVAASTKVQQSALRQVAAEERLTAALSESGSAEARLATETARVASAQAGAIGASQRLAATQREAEGASRGLTGGLGGTIKMAGQLGLVFGAFEVIKKAIDITKEANDFQRAMVQVQTNADVSAAEVNKASGALLHMAGPVAAAPAELATAWYHAKSVGLDYAKSIDTTRIAAEGARVGHADLEETMNALTSTVASNIPGVKNMSSAMGQLIAIVGSGDMKLSDLNAALGSGILTVVKGYGLSLTDVGAALATFGDNNIRGAEAATMLRMSVQAMAVPAIAGRKELTHLGLSATTLAKDMQTGGLNKAILDLKSHLDKAGVSSVQVGAVLTQVFGKRAGPGVAVLVSQVDRLESKFKILRDSGASFSDKWKATTQTASFALASLGHSAEAAGIAFTTKLGPYIASAVRWLGAALPTAIGTARDVLAPFGAAWGVLATGLVAAGHAAAAVVSFLSPMAPVLKFIATDVLVTWAAFKGYRIVSAAIVAVRGALVSLGASATGSLTALRAWGRAVGSMLDGTGTQSGMTAAIMQADMLQMGAAAQTEAADVDAAAAQQAEAYAQMVAASDDATANMISNSQNYALAVQEQADASAAAAATVTASADAAAAGVASAGEEASIGWVGVLGPLAAVGIGIALLTTLFGGNDKAAENNKAIMQGYADSLKQSSNALAAVNTTQTIKNLQDDKSIGLLNQLHSSNTALGVSQGDLVLAVNGSSQAYDELHTKLLAIAAANKDVAFSAGKGGGGVTYSATGKAALALAKNIDTLRHSFTAQQRQQALGQKIERQTQALADGGASAASKQAKALGLTSNAYLDAQTAAKKNTDQTNAQTIAFQVEGDAASLLQQALDGLAGINLSVATAQTGLASATAAAAASFKKNGSAINGSSAAAIANQQAIESQVQAAQQLALANDKGAHSQANAVKSFEGAKSALENQLRSQGKLTPAVQAYINKLYDLKDLNAYLKAHPTPIDAKTAAAQKAVADIQTRIKNIRQGKAPNLAANSAEARGVIRNLQIEMNAIKQGAPPNIDVADAEAYLKIKALERYIANLKLTAHLYVETSGSGQKYRYVPGSGVIPIATGGQVHGPGTGTSDSIPARLSNGEFVTNAKQAAKHLPLLHAINSGAPGFASGGLVGNEKSIAESLRAALGLGKAGIAGVLGNLQIESNFNPRAIGGPAHGIAQWQGGRFAALQAFARSHNRQWSNLGIQEQFLEKELGGMPGLLHTLRSTRNAGGAASLFDQVFERSDGTARGARMSAAAGFARALRGTNLSGGSGSSSSGSSAASKAAAAQRAAVKRLQEQAKNIAAAAKDFATTRTAVDASVGKLFGVGPGGTARGGVVGASTIVGQLSGWEKALAKAGVPSKAMAQLSKDNRFVYNAAVARNKVAGQLMTAQKNLQASIAGKTADTASFRSAVVGTFDITSAGADANGNVAGGAIMAQEAQAVTRAKAWVAGIKKLAGLKVFPGDFLRQLAAKGPDALPEVQALSHLSLADDKLLRSNYLELSSLGQQAGVIASRRLDDPGIAKYSAQVKALEARELALQKNLVADLNKTLAAGMHDLSHVIETTKWKFDFATGTLSRAVKTDEKKLAHGRGHS